MNSTGKLYLCFILFQILLLIVPQGLQAQYDPSIEWKEIETESAYWLFDARHQQYAERAVLQFERAKNKVLPLFKEPSRKLTIVLIDNSDLANGSAQVTPLPIMNLFTVLPTRLSSIGEFDDYLYELLIHEYTHILNMEPVHGWVLPFYWIFGSIAHPNMILPRWYTEGLAVYTESILSNQSGRLNSQYLSGWARALTLEKRWKDYPLSALNDDHPDTLGAARAYLFGGILWDGLVQTGGLEGIYKLNQSYSRRPPYLLSGPIQEHLQSSYEVELAKIYDQWNERAQKQISTVFAAPLIEPTPLSKMEDSASTPAISPDGLWLAYTNREANGQTNVILTLRHPQKGFHAYKGRIVIPQTTTESIAWHPTGDGFVYDKAGSYNRYYFYYDLYYYDINTQKSRPITKGERAHQACFTPNGQHLFFLQNTTGRRNLAVMDWATQKIHTVYQGDWDENIPSLTCDTNENAIILVQKPQQQHLLKSIALNGETKDYKTPFKKMRFLLRTHKGMMVSSPDSGIENLYLLSKEDSWKAVTNSPTRVVDGALDPLTDDLYFSEQSALGWQIRSLRAAQWESLQDHPPRVEPIFQPQHNNNIVQEPAKAETSVESSAVTPKIEPEDIVTKVDGELIKRSGDFSPWRYLYPNHWIPFLYLVDGGTLYQAMTSAGDPLGQHSLSLVGQWDTLTKQPGINLSYMNRTLPVQFGFGASDFYSFFYNTRSTLHFTNGSFVMAYPFAFLQNAQALFRWNYSALELSPFYFTRQGPQLELSYRKLKQTRYAVSPHEGVRTELGHRTFLSDFGNQSYNETYAHLGTYWSSFTPRNHTLYWGINASYAPQLNNGFFATSTLAGPFLNPQITNTSFLQRGYPTGIFVARNIVNTNIEYRFPMLPLYRGWTSPPVFFKNLQGALVFDATTIDGRYSNSRLASSQVAKLGDWFQGYGLELESNQNIGFHVPVTFTLGLYYGENLDSYGGFTTFFNIRL